MHILLIHQAFTTLDEAGGTRHAELARYLCSFGHRVTVIASPLSYLTGKTSTAKESDATLKEQGITVLRTYTFPVGIVLFSSGLSALSRLCFLQS
jgi:hypothetical protein